MTRTTAATLALLILTACAGTLEAPPLEITYRDSLVGIGKIIQITNQGESALEGIDVRFENPGGDVKHHRLSSLAAGESVELGWRKLGGFQIEVGAEVSVRAEGFGLPYLVELVADSDES